MKQVLIVGGSSGMGLALANKLISEETFKVTVTGRSETGLQALKARIRSSRFDIRVLQLTDSESIRQAIGSLTELDHLVLAGSSDAVWGPFAEIDPAAVLKAFEVKTLGYMRVIQAALPKLAPDASITLLGGAAGRKAMPGTVGLAAVNGALQAITRSLAVELAPRRVNLISPGLTDTQAYAGMPDEQRQAMFAAAANSLPVGRVGKPEDIAGMIASVMENEFITGAMIDVDGGASL